MQCFLPLHPSSHSTGIGEGSQQDGIADQLKWLMDSHVPAPNACRQEMHNQTTVPDRGGLQANSPSVLGIALKRTLASPVCRTSDSQRQPKNKGVLFLGVLLF